MKYPSLIAFSRHADRLRNRHEDHGDFPTYSPAPLRNNRDYLLADMLPLPELGHAGELLVIGGRLLHPYKPTFPDAQLELLSSEP